MCILQCHALFNTTLGDTCKGPLTLIDVYPNLGPFNNVYLFYHVRVMDILYIKFLSYIQIHKKVAVFPGDA